MRLPQAAVYEVATFYSHFDVVKEGETPPPPTTIRVCDSITCELKGAETLLASLRLLVDRYPAETVVYPGHGPATTLGAELARNPFLADLRREREEAAE